MLLKPPLTIDFDPANKYHRQAVANFLKRFAWCDSQFRFSHDPEYTSVADQVQSKMLKYYMQTEFNKPIKQTARKK